MEKRGRHVLSRGEAILGVNTLVPGLLRQSSMAPRSPMGNWGRSSWRTSGV